MSNMAFVSPTSLILTRSATIGSSASLFVRESHLATLTAVPENGYSRPVSASFNFGRKRDFKTEPQRTRDFQTASQVAPPSVVDSANLGAYVVAIDTVCQAKHHFQVTLDVGAYSLAESHVAPGQFVQIGRMLQLKRGRSMRAVAFLTLSNPPGGTADGHVEVLFAAGADPLDLRSLKTGDRIDISPVMGSGIDHQRVTRTAGDLYIFTDCVQGFATVKSLIEWGTFRAMSGEGANRTNHIVIYYAIPSRKSLPFHERLSTWSVYAVNLVPLPGISIMEYMSTPGALGRARHSLSMDHALACVVSPDTFEALFCSLVLQGFRRDGIHRHTDETVASEVRTFNKTAFNVWDKGTSQGKEQREAVEREIWQNWVNVRERMRSEFERKWAVNARNMKQSSRTEEEKKQAWASWFAKNKDQWSQVQWDNEQWGSYWSSWKTSGDGGAHSSSPSGSKYAWSQQNSQEYWDWARKGTESGKSSASSGQSHGSWDHDAYGGSSKGWGSNSKSSYKKGGYKYAYEESEEDKNKYGGYGGSYYGGGQSSQSGRSSGQWTNRDNRRRQSSSRNEQRKWGSGGSSGSSGGAVFGDLDFYAVLGITSSASRSDIKKAYRKKAMEHHPDLNPGQTEEANVKMKQIVVAWSVLKDESKRRTYDKNGSGGF